nr:MAG TPA: hypothetical protein [Caudoviricetes sp.]
MIITNDSVSKFSGPDIFSVKSTYYSLHSYFILLFI